MPAAQPSPSGAAPMTLPYIAMAPRPASSQLVLLTPASVHLVDVETSSILSHLPAITLPDPKVSPESTASTTLVCPRYVAWSAPTTPGQPSPFLAVGGDDKILRIFHISEDGKQGLKLGEEVVLVYLQKRPCRLQWENAQRVVVGDRHGDIRVAEIKRDESGALQRLVVGTPKRPAGGQPGQAKKKAKVEGGGDEAPAAAEASDSKADEDKDEEQEEEDALLAAGLEPKVGHVGMLTSFHLSEPCGTSTIARSIISADRDEHIRVSRWGNDCLGYVVRRYLLGSLGAVGALALVPPSSPAEHHILISGDGGDKLRIWDWAQDGPAKLVVSLSSAVKGSVQVNAGVEKLRERGGWQADGSNAKMKDLMRNGINKKGNKAKAEEDDEARKAREDSAYPEIISRIEVFKPAGGEAQIIFLLDGSSTMFHIALDEVLKRVRWDSTEVIPEEVDLADSVKAVKLGSPILDVAFLEQKGGRMLLASCDTRPGVMGRSSEGAQEEDETPIKSAGKLLSLLAFSVEQGIFVPVEASHPSAPFFDAASQGGLEGASTRLPATASHEDVLRVTLYNSLVQVPKLAAETRYALSHARRRTKQGDGDAAEEGREKKEGEQKLTKRQLGKLRNKKTIDEAVQRAA